MRADSQRGQLAVLWLGQFLVTAGLTLLVPLMPFYLEELGAARGAEALSWSGFALAAPAVPLVVAAPLWGRLGDRRGREWMVARALFGVSASVILMGCATNPAQFVLCRLLQGALGGVDDAAAAFAAARFPGRKLGEAMGVLQTATAAGALVGPLCGGFLSRLVGFHVIIVTVGVLIGICGTAAALLLRAAEPSSAACAEGTEEGSRSLSCWAATRSFLAERGVLAMLAAGFAVQVGAYGLMNVFATHVRELSPAGDSAYGWVGFLQAATWAMTLIGASWWGRRNDRHPCERNFLLASAGCALALSLQALPTGPAWLLPMRLLQGFCQSALGQSVFLRVGRGGRGSGQGLRIGLSNSFLTAGQVVGALLGSVLAGYLPARAVFVVLAGAFLLGGALAWRSGERRETAFRNKEDKRWDESAASESRARREMEPYPARR